MTWKGSDYALGRCSVQLVALNVVPWEMLMMAEMMVIVRWTMNLSGEGYWSLVNLFVSHFALLMEWRVMRRMGYMRSDAKQSRGASGCDEDKCAAGEESNWL